MVNTNPSKRIVCTNCDSRGNGKPREWISFAELRFAGQRGGDNARATTKTSATRKIEEDKNNEE